MRWSIIVGLVICLFLSLSCARTRREKKIPRVKEEEAVSSHYERGRAYLKEGFIIDATREFEKAIEENPDDIRPHY